MATRLSPNFTLEELCVSSKAEELGILNMPTVEHRRNLLQVAVYMEWVRSIFNKPIIITSGYRNPKVNKAVGGVSNSDHALGWAVDFRIPKHPDSLVEIGKEIVRANIPFDQLIYEKSRGILHISFHPRMRRQLLTQRGGPGTPFEQGLVA